MTLVLSRHARAWPAHAEQPCRICTRKGNTCHGPDPAEHFGFVEAFSQAFDDDAHFVAYTIDEDMQHRLDYGAIGRVPIVMALFVVDVEPANHAPRTKAWDDDQGPRIERAIADGAFFYSTRGGYRLVWKMAVGFGIETKQDAEDWKASYLGALAEVEARYGIIGDKACKDWTRLYRLPFVVRDGVQQETETSDVLSVGVFGFTRVHAPAVDTRLAPVASDATPPSEALIQHVRERLKRHGPAIEGHGGDQHTYEACAIVCRGFDLPDDVACMLLDEWNQTCRPPWDGDELRTKMDNASNYAQGEPGEERASWEAEQKIKRGLERVLGPDYNASTSMPVLARSTAPTIMSAPATSGRDLLLALLDTPEPSEDDAWNIFLSSWASLSEALAMPDNYPAMYAAALDEVYAYAGAIESSAANIANERPFFKSAAELFATPDHPPRMLVERLVMEGGVGVVSGEPKSAKTWLTMEILIGVATGLPVLGKYKTIAGTVAYFFTEDMEAAIKAHLRALLAGQGKSTDIVGRTFHAQPRGYHIDITRAEDCARIIASVRNIERKSGKVRLLALDPLRNIHNLDEDKSGEMVKVFECLKMIGKLLDVTILLVHHAKKASQGSTSKRGGQKMRGSSALHGFLDSGIYLDDLRVSDDGTLITNAFESEIKAARSAGKFELALKIEDDEYTHSSKRATWIIGKANTATANATPHEVERLEDTAAAMITAARHHMLTTKKTNISREKLYESARGSAKSKDIAIDWAMREGYLQRAKGNMMYKLTTKGIELAKAREPGAREEQPPTGSTAAQIEALME